MWKRRLQQSRAALTVIYDWGLPNLRSEYLRSFTICERALTDQDYTESQKEQAWQAQQLRIAEATQVAKQALQLRLETLNNGFDV